MIRHRGTVLEGERGGGGTKRTHLVIDEAEMFELGVNLSIDYGFCIRMRHVLAVIPKLVLKLDYEQAPGLWAAS